MNREYILQKRNKAYEGKHQKITQENVYKTYFVLW